MIGGLCISMTNKKSFKFLSPVAIKKKIFCQKNSLKNAVSVIFWMFCKRKVLWICMLWQEYWYWSPNNEVSQTQTSKLFWEASTQQHIGFWGPNLMKSWGLYLVGDRRSLTMSRTHFASCSIQNSDWKTSETLSSSTFPMTIFSRFWFRPRTHLPLRIRFPLSI